MTKTVRGGNTNLYKTRISPKRTIRKSPRDIKRKLTRGAGVFAYLAKGLKSVSRAASKKLPTIANIAKRAVNKGTIIAKEQLRKPSVQKALRSAVTEGTKLAANHVLKTVSGDNSANYKSKKSKFQTKRRNIRKGRKRRGNNRPVNRLLFQE